MSAIISARSLRKQYGEFIAVHGIDFDVEQGECFGMLGPNGAGKTSTIRMTTCISPTSGGTLLVAGRDVSREPRAVKALLGVVSQDDNLDRDLTVRENLLVYARYFDIPRPDARASADEVLRLFQLAEKQHEQVDALSGGMKRRLTIARALMSAPQVLVLDEPTTGLDPQARHLVWRQLRVLKERGLTLLLTTHYMDEAARLCDRLVIMHEGRILVCGTPRELIRDYAGHEVVEIENDRATREQLAERLVGAEGVRFEQGEDALLVHTDGPAAALLEQFQLFGDDVLVRRANLEDVFLRLTGRGLQD